MSELGSLRPKTGATIALGLSALALAACGSSSSSNSSASGGGGGSSATGTASASATSSSAASSSGPASPGVDTATKTITVGGWEIASGPNAGFVATTNAVKALFSMWNAKGGVNGWKIKYLAPDDGGNPTRALQIVKSQVEGKQVFALVWGPGSPENQEVVPFVAQQTSLPYMPPGESGDPYIGKAYTNIFPTIPPYSAQAIFMAQYAIQHLGAKKIALAYEDDAVGQPVQQRFKDAVTKLGAQVVAEESYQATDVDLSAVGQKLAAAKPDVVINWGTAGPTVKAKAAAMGDGLNVPWFNPYFLADPAVVALNKSAMEGTYYDYYLDPFYSNTPDVKQFKDAMAKYEKGTDAGGLALNGWAGAAVFVAALQDITAGGKTPTQSALLDTLNHFGTQKVGVLPSVHYSPTSHTGGNEGYIIQYKNGAFSTVAGPSPLPQEK
jgi:branched-chain amino acid transport system substrate-binding protein